MERSIETCKNHFISGIATIDPVFSVSKWGRLFPQFLITLNLLHNSRFNPGLSAYAYLFGIYDFNKSTMAPPGTHVIVHDVPVNHTSWGHHATPGWYIGQSLDHYRCMQCYIPATGIFRITDTLQYIHKSFSFPKTTTENYLQQVIGDIIAIMKDPLETFPFFILC